MKAQILLISLSLSASFALAQRPDSIAKTRKVDGTIMSSASNLVTNISASPELTKITNAIKTAELADELKTGPITFFAPDNKAFEKLPAGILDTLLLPKHKNDLINLIKYHAINGRVTSKDIERAIKADNGQASFTTLSGGTIIARINENRNIVLTDENGGQSIIARLDIEQSNGLLFIITAVLSPKSKQ